MGGRGRADRAHRDGRHSGYGAPTVEPEIGAGLFISAKTASVRVANILAKLRVTSRGEAAAAAHRQRLLHPAPEPLQQLVAILGREPQIGLKPSRLVSRF